jgi:hypothetical protein
MSAQVALLGIREVLNTLEVLPDAVRDDAQRVIRASAMSLYRDLGNAVPVGPGGTRKKKRYSGGALRKSVRMQHVDELRSMVWYGTNAGGGAPHGNLYESGTKHRTDPTRKGASRGAMPASKLLARLASAERRTMNDALVIALDSVLRRLGLRAAA